MPPALLRAALSLAISGLLLAGCGGAVFLLLLLDFLWRRRFRAVRRPLVTLRSKGISQL